MKPRPIGPLIPFRAGLAILVLAKEQPVLARFRLTAAAGMDDFQHSDGVVARAVLLHRRYGSEPIRGFAGIGGPS